MIDKDKVKPMTPGMKMLLEGGGPTAFYKKLIPLKKGAAPKLGNSIEAASVAVPVDRVAAKAVPILGQAQAQGQAPAETQQVPKCPGPVALPDGRILEPDDYIQLQDLCEIMPYLMAAMRAAMAPGQQVRVAGGIPGVQGVPAPSMFGGTGGPLGPYGSGAPAGGFSGGGGGVGPRGPAGERGADGADGAGIIIETPVIKTDGGFSVAAGPFVPIPGTSITFTMASDGVAMIYGIVTGGSGASDESQNFQIGVRIDGVDYPLSARCLHTFAGGVGEFLVPSNFAFPVSLGAGAHTVEMLLRGLTAGEFGGGGLGTAGNVYATTELPLIMAVSHS